MSLTLSLNNALSGLKTNQQAISVLSHNIANANTDGYSRQIVQQQALYINGTGSGVRIDDVVRKVDIYLQRAVISQGAEQARTGVVNDYYQKIDILMGTPGANNTLDQYMTGFFNSVQALAETPDRVSAQSNVISAATALAGDIAGMANDLHDLRFQADQEMRTTVDNVNGVLNKLYKLNNAINTAGSTGQSTAGLLDQRDSALRELSGYVDITTTYGVYGSVSVATGNGVALLDENVRQLKYAPAQSADAFVGNSSLNALMVYEVDSNGKPMGNGQTLISGGTEGNIVSGLQGGSLEGLRLMRDDVIPAMLSQMDELASNLRDAVNTIHNDGSGFPAATSLTGTRGLTNTANSYWSGSVRIAVLNKDGTPVVPGYADEKTTGIRPLTLNLAKLNSGSGDGNPSLQSIVNEINARFGAPTTKAELGKLNSIKLVSDTDKLPLGVGSKFSFDFEVENIANSPASFFVGNVSVKDANGVDITNVTNMPSSFSLDPADAYYTTAGIPDVTINLTTTTHGIQPGDTIYLGPPGTASVNGIAAADLTGYFTVIGVGGESVTIQARSSATTTGDVADASGVRVQNAFGTGNDKIVQPGATDRTRDEGGQIEVDFGASPNSAYYDITVSVATLDDTGNLLTSDVTYRIENGKSTLLNDRYVPISATGDGKMVLPTTSQETLRAILVDENGKELPRQTGGDYVEYSPSYLQIYSPSGNYTVAIDEMDSKELGDPSANPQVPGSGWGFSHYFGLNDFFTPNNLVDGGDTVKGSAVNLAVAKRLIDNPSLISTGELVLSPQPADPTAQKQFTYTRYSGDNTLATRLNALATQNLAFTAAGNLPTVNLTLGGYTSQFLGNYAAQSAAAGDSSSNAQTLYDGLKTQADSVSGVNLDEELANTVIFQNSYSATARIITIVNQMFDDVLQMV